MTLYIILAALLLAAIIAVVILKKKGSGLKSGKKGKKKQDINESFDDTTTEFSQPAEFSRSSSSLDAQTRRDIENLIRNRQYSAAEAQINQALHQNPTQQELYVMLAEVHLYQDDEFALEQLLEHLRLSGLHSVVETIDAKREAFKAQAQREAEQSKMAAATTLGAGAVATSQFDQLNNLGSTSAQTAPVSFDDLMSASPSPAPSATNTAMDFNFAQPEPEPVAQPAPAQNQALDFSFSQPTPAQETAPAFDFSQLETAKAEEPAPAQNQALDFSFSQPAPAQETAPAFDFSQLETAKAEEPAPAQSQGLDFSFSQPAPAQETAPAFDFSQLETAKAEEPAPVAETVQGFDFNFSQPEPTVQETQPVETTAFDFAQPEPVVEQSTQGFDFNFAQAETTATPVAQNTEEVFDMSDLLAETPAPSTTDASLDFSQFNTENVATVAEVESHSIENLAVTAPSTPTSAFTSEEAPVVLGDPLLQAFPALGKSNEADVTLKLAEQYMKLGAYESVSVLLKNRHGFSDEQNQNADALLQRLAS